MLSTFMSHLSRRHPSKIITTVPLQASEEPTESYMETEDMPETEMSAVLEDTDNSVHKITKSAGLLYLTLSSKYHVPFSTQQIVVNSYQLFIDSMLKSFL